MENTMKGAETVLSDTLKRTVVHSIKGLKSIGSKLK